MSEQIDFIIELAKDYDIDLSNYYDYSLEQIIEIFRGFKDNVDVSIYDSKEIQFDKMCVIRECLLKELPKPVITAGYTVHQLKRIIEIHEMGIDLKFIENPKPDMDKHFDKLIEYKKLTDILLWDKSQYKENIVMGCFIMGYSFKQIRYIAKAVDDDLDVTPMLDKAFSEEQLHQLYLIMKDRIDPKQVLDPHLSWIDMAMYRLRN